MRYPQLLIYETDGRLARILEATAGTHRWVLRQPRKMESGLRLLRQGGPAILVLSLDSDLDQSLTLLTRTTESFPDVLSVVAVENDNTALADLAWDLGAAYVLTPRQPRDLLLDIVAGLMGAMGSQHEPE
jgi:DNA-binding response OmpR family regulator